MVIVPSPGQPREAFWLVVRRQLAAFWHMPEKNPPSKSDVAMHIAHARRSADRFFESGRQPAGLDAVARRLLHDLRTSRPIEAQVAVAAAKGDRTTAQVASHFGVHPSQVTAWKKQLMAQVAELFVDRRQRHGEQAPDEQATDEQEFYEQIGRLRMRVEWLNGARQQVHNP